MQAAAPIITRIVAGLIGILWCYIEPSLNYISVCFFALVLDCYTAWRCNRRIYSRYREAIKRNPKCKMDGKLRSKKMAKMVQDFSVLIMAIFLAVIIDNDLLAHMGELHLANYLAVIYCSVQFVSILENESTCNGAAWARVVQKIVADKTERHFNIKLKELMADVENMEKSDADASTENTPTPDPETETETETNPKPQEDK
nr:MAG TPA: holin [Caudoviricetes sp.]